MAITDKLDAACDPLVIGAGGAGMTAALTAAIKNFRLLLGENCGAPVGCQLFRTAKHVLAEHGVDVSELDPVSDASIHRSD